MPAAVTREKEIKMLNMMINEKQIRTIDALTADESRRIFRELAKLAIARASYDYDFSLNYASCEAQLWSPDYKAVLLYRVGFCEDPLSQSDRYTFFYSINNLTVREFTLDVLPIELTGEPVREFVEAPNYWFDTENGVLYRDNDAIVRSIYDKIDREPDDSEESWIAVDNVIERELGFVPNYEIN